MIKAAGILLLSKQDRILFLKRGAGSDNPGEWCFPGGRLEENEQPIDAAIRETEEETGGFKAIKSRLQPWTRRIAPRETTGAAPTPPPDNPQEPLVILKELATATEIPPIQLPGEEVDFTTFVLKDVVEFVPDVAKSGEHTAYAWAKPEDAPLPLHPGARIALDRFGMNELGVAKAMMEGQLTSPQRYGSFALFDIRITGTGVAYRHRKMEGKKVIRDEEFVYRNPADYLTGEFLERCNGLLVVMEHPDVLAMDHAEFEKRTVGTVFKAYIKGDEVWAIAKIYNEDAIEVMAEQQLSTSPGVVWRSPDANVMTQVDGHNFLLEGKPSLMDHIAVCYQGVWDKSGPPVGVRTAEARKDSVAMNKEELEAILKANKAETDTAITGLMAGLETIAGAVKNITARFDSENKEKDKERKDAARARVDGMKFSSHHAEDGEHDARKRHDAEESAMCDAMEEAGEEKEAAKDKAKRARKDAARMRADAFKFSARKDGESEEEHKKRGDAEERMCAYDAEEAGEEKEKAAAAAKDKRKRHDDDGEKERKDMTGLTAQNIEMQKRLEAMQKVIDERIPAKSPIDDDPKAFAMVQSRFDDVFPLLGLQTPRPMQFESLLSYKKRGAMELQKHSRTYKDRGDSITSVAAVNAGLFDPMFDVIVSEAAEVARTDAAVPAGQLIEHRVKLASGAPAIEWRGKTGAWMREFMPNGRVGELKRFNALGKAQ